MAPGVQAKGVNWETAQLEVLGRGVPVAQGSQLQALSADSAHQGSLAGAKVQARSVDADPQARFAGAAQQARSDVEQQLLKMIQALQVDAAHTGAALLLADTDRLTAVMDLCKNFTVTQTTYFADSRVEIAATLPLYAGVAQALLGEVAASTQAGVSALSADSAELESLLPTLRVIVRGQSVRPSLAPRLCDPSGQDVLAADVRAAALQLQLRFTQSRAAAPADSGGLRSSLQVEGQALQAPLAKPQKQAQPLVEAKMLPASTDVMLSADDAREVRKFLQLLKDSADEVRVVFILP
jgi:hypothetical protein